MDRAAGASQAVVRDQDTGDKSQAHGGQPARIWRTRHRHGNGNGNGAAMASTIPISPCPNARGRRSQGVNGQVPLAPSGSFGGNSATGGAVAGVAGGNGTHVAGYGGQGTGNGTGIGTGNGTGYWHRIWPGMAPEMARSAMASTTPMSPCPNTTGLRPRAAVPRSFPPTCPTPAIMPPVPPPGTSSGSSSNNGVVGGVASSAAMAPLAAAEEIVPEDRRAAGTIGQGNPIRGDSDGYIIGQPQREQ